MRYVFDNKTIYNDKGESYMLNLKAARFLFTLTVREPMILPPYKGSTFRGGFGNVFRRIACSRRRRDYDGCLLTAACPYWLLFEPGPPAGTEMLRRFEEIPRDRKSTRLNSSHVRI